MINLPNVVTDQVGFSLSLKMSYKTVKMLIINEMSIASQQLASYDVAKLLSYIYSTWLLEVVDSLWLSYLTSLSLLHIHLLRWIIIINTLLESCIWYGYSLCCCSIQSDHHQQNKCFHHKFSVLSSEVQNSELRHKLWNKSLNTKTVGGSLKLVTVHIMML